MRQVGRLIHLVLHYLKITGYRNIIVLVTYFIVVLHYLKITGYRNAV